MKEGSPCLRRDVTPTAIQSLPVSWPRRFQRNDLNVFSLISMILFVTLQHYMYATKPGRASKISCELWTAAGLRTADCELGAYKIRTRYKMRTTC